MRRSTRNLLIIVAAFSACLPVGTNRAKAHSAATAIICPCAVGTPKVIARTTTLNDLATIICLLTVSTRVVTTSSTPQRIGTHWALVVGTSGTCTPLCIPFAMAKVTSLDHLAQTRVLYQPQNLGAIVPHTIRSAQELQYSFQLETLVIQNHVHSGLLVSSAKNCQQISQNQIVASLVSHQGAQLVLSNS